MFVDNVGNRGRACVLAFYTVSNRSIETLRRKFEEYSRKEKVMYRILAFILMLCLTVPVSVLAAPNPNDNALEKASDNARFNRDDDDDSKGKKDKKHNE